MAVRLIGSLLFVTVSPDPGCPRQDMYLTKPVGLMSLLDEETHMPKASDYSLGQFGGGLIILLVCARLQAI